MRFVGILVGVILCLFITIAVIGAIIEEVSGIEQENDWEY